MTGAWEGEADIRPWTTFLTLELAPERGGELRVGGQGLPVTAVRREGTDLVHYLKKPISS